MAEGRALWQVRPHIILFQAVLLSITVLAVNLLGDGLRVLPRSANCKTPVAGFKRGWRSLASGHPPQSSLLRIVRFVAHPQCLVVGADRQKLRVPPNYRFPPNCAVGRMTKWHAGCPPCPVSQVCLLRKEKRVVNLDAEVAHGALQLCMAEQELTGAQIAGAFIDQRDLRSAETVSSIERWIQSDQTHPGVEETAVLARCDVITMPATAREEPILFARASLSEPRCECLAGQID